MSPGSTTPEDARHVTQEGIAPSLDKTQLTTPIINAMPASCALLVPVVPNPPISLQARNAHSVVTVQRELQKLYHVWLEQSESTSVLKKTQNASSVSQITTARETEPQKIALQATGASQERLTSKRPMTPSPAETLTHAVDNQLLGPIPHLEIVILSYAQSVHTHKSIRLMSVQKTA